jgi:hypothetical protein
MLKLLRQRRTGANLGRKSCRDGGGANNEVAALQIFHGHSPELV